jgi:hypothetical protein
MKHPIRIGLALVLAVIIYLNFERPHEMLSPGNLIPAHSALQTDCFACHAPLRGVAADRCITCHAVTDIGLRTTKGVKVTSSKGRPPFHQALLEPNCMACHSDHTKPKFVHARALRFDHSLLKAEVRANCQSCHVPPRDAVHKAPKLACSTCHQAAGWKPATFDHNRFFALDKDHNTACTTCHLDGLYKRYTCYGCHEHQQAKIIAAHREEGMINIEKCARCHRRAEGEVEREGEGRED